MMDSRLEARIAEKLRFLYGHTEPLDSLLQIVSAHPISPRTASLSERDALVIAYGDHILRAGEAPLKSLHAFARQYLRDITSGIHILPFFPYTSDDGFSVVDFTVVDAALGDWAMVKELGADFRLMFDLVLNHISASSEWFQRFLKDEVPYRDYFVTAAPTDDLSGVVRPRTHPLLTAFETKAGTRYVWTTFSADQVDLNYSNPAVLLEIVKILLLYVRQGAAFIRLDAVAFLWKIPGTSCIHLPQTHVVIQLLRDVLEAAAPWVLLITETNVPHNENLSYFADGNDEAHMVYQFALPPLLLHSFYTGSATILSEWAASLATPSDSTSFFNFTASHDGIGLRPLTGLVPYTDIEHIQQIILSRNGQVSYRLNSDGTRSPYELNITYFDALAVPGEPLTLSVDRFIASQAIMLVLVGVPGIYLPSLFGSANWGAGVEQTGRARTINREKFDLATLAKLLDDPNTRQGRVFTRYRQLLRLRRSHAAFHPNSPQRILDMGGSVFALERGGLLTLCNVSDHSERVALPPGSWHDLLAGQAVDRDLTLGAYQVAWLISGVND